ncbi:MAG: response regulator, partial [Chloroflexi bacterium]|nr:response regulator [Chloroflexota bacterium]
SAEAGLALLNQSVPEFALVLLDASLPGGLDGSAAARRIKHDPRFAHIPVLLMIGAAEMMQQKENGSLDGYLIKPITRSQLFDAVIEVFGQKRPANTKTKSMTLAGLEKLCGARVLLVEDNEINQIVALDLLQGMGLQVTLANNGEQALDLVKKEHFDVVLMDIQMPGMDGYQATAQIRLTPQANAAQLPIIAMTANAMESDRQKALEAGMNDYVSKPVDVTQLANVLIHWVNSPAEKAAAVAASENQAPGALSPGSGNLPESHLKMPMGDGRVELPDTLEPINMLPALARLGDNKQHYQRLLHLFHTEHEQTAQAIRAALKSEDSELAGRLAHNLKGGAGTVGADELRAAAKQLETVIAAGNEPFYEEFLLQVEQKLAVVMASIARLE